MVEFWLAVGMWGKKLLAAWLVLKFFFAIWLAEDCLHWNIFISMSVKEIGIGQGFFRTVFTLFGFKTFLKNWVLQLMIWVFQKFADFWTKIVHFFSWFWLQISLKTQFFEGLELSFRAKLSSWEILGIWVFGWIVADCSLSFPFLAESGWAILAWFKKYLPKSGFFVHLSKNLIPPKVEKLNFLEKLFLKIWSKLGPKTKFCKEEKLLKNPN